MASTEQPPAPEIASKSQGEGAEMDRIDSKRGQIFLLRLVGALLPQDVASIEKMF
jgi:hypothetical protein